MATEVGSALTRPVAAAAADRLDDGTTATAIGRRTEVANPAGSQLLAFTSTASSPEQARRVADAVARSYLEVRRDTAAERVSRLDGQIGAALGRLDRIRRTPGRDAKAQELGARQGRLLATQVVPGELVTPAGARSTRVGPGPLVLGASGLALGLLVGTAVALVRRESPTDASIGTAERLDDLVTGLVLDGTQDADEAVTWDLAAFMLPIPKERDAPFLIMVDAGPRISGQVVGKQLVQALGRRGEPSTFIDAGLVHPGKIARGWPTERKRETWGEQVVVLDTTTIGSQTSKVDLATRVDMVVLARSVDDDARDVRRLDNLLRSREVSVDLVTVFPSSPEMVSLDA
ncbi:MAG: hypothetical protein PGN07_00520 [Aeromicrobium erythreum]